MYRTRLLKVLLFIVYVRPSLAMLEERFERLPAGDRQDVLNEKLYCAVRNGKSAQARKLKEGYGADPDAQLTMLGGRTALHAAVSGGAEMVRLLSDEFYADPLVGDEAGELPLHLAAQDGDESVVKELCEAHVRRGCSVDDTGGCGKTPLYMASAWGNEPAVRCLLYAGADSNWSTDDLYPEAYFTPLMVAAYRLCLGVVRLLLEPYLYVDVSAQNGEGRTALEIAQAVNVEPCRRKRSWSSCCTACEFRVARKQAIVDLLDTATHQYDEREAGPRLYELRPAC